MFLFAFDYIQERSLKQNKDKRIVTQLLEEFMNDAKDRLLKKGNKRFKLYWEKF